MKLTIALAGTAGLCEAPKCVRKAGHDGDHWPTGESPGFGPLDPASPEPTEVVGIDAEILKGD